MSGAPEPLLIAGATGYIGGILARELVADGIPVRCLVRDRSRAADLEALGCEIVVGDVLVPETLPAALEGVEVAYYLVHSMGRGGGGDFAERDRRAAENFAAAASDAGVRRIVYLGGPRRAGLQAPREPPRDRRAARRDRGVPLTYFRAAAVIGVGQRVVSDRPATWSSACR